MKKRAWILGSLAVLLAGGAIFVEATIGWSMIVGMLRYDTRREGDLKVGDKAPSVVLHEIETGAATQLFDQPPLRPVILVFGSFT